jgi:hypothetical protein
MKKILGLILLCVTMAGATSCTQENDNAEKVLLSKTSYTMYSDATTTIEGSGLTNATWSSDNEFVAVANGNTISSDKVGSTNLYCNGQKISVTVKPSYSLYTEPDMSWGSSKSSIIAKYGTPSIDNGNTIIYKTNNSNVPLVAYMFDQRGLYSSGVGVSLNAAYRLVDFLIERYVIFSINTTNYTATFAHCYGKKNNPQIDYTGQMAYQSSIGGILVVYAGNSTKSNNIDTIFNSMAESINGR